MVDARRGRRPGARSRDRLKAEVDSLEDKVVGLNLENRPMMGEASLKESGADRITAMRKVEESGEERGSVGKTVIKKAKESASFHVEEVMSEIVSEVVESGVDVTALDRFPDLPPVNPNIEGNPVGYVKSYLSMGSELTVKRLLKARGIRASRGEIVEPQIDIVLPSQSKIASKAVEQVVVGLKARQVVAPKDAKVKKSKYSVSVD